MTEQLYCFGLLQSGKAPTTLSNAHPFKLPTTVKTGDFEAIVSSIDVTELPPKRRFLRAQASLLEGLGGTCTILPMRFGTIAPSVEALRDAVGRNATRIAELFEMLEGCQEYGVSIRMSQAAMFNAALSANRELRERRDDLARRGSVDTMTAMRFGQQLSDAAAALRRRHEKALDRFLRGVVRDLILRAPESEAELLRADILVQKDCSGALDALLERIESGGQPSIDGRSGQDLPVDIRLIGPAPVYSFASCTLDFHHHSDHCDSVQASVRPN
ncbi:MAG: GvpL/GvpF family gas vesicle protein [Pseudomonadota bacterium]